MSAPSEKSVIFCTECGALNGVPHGSDLTQGKCGSCKAPLSTAKPRKIDDAQFDRLRARDTGAYIIDLWAPWCGPCKQLTPILEKVVTEARGGVKLVKVDIDKNPEIAQQLRVQSIPAVFAFSGGRPVDAFQGALPESQIKAFVDKLTATAGTTQTDPIADALAQAKEMHDAEDFAAASSIYQQVLKHDPENLPAKAGLSRCFVTAGELAQASEVLTSVPEDKRDDSEIAAAWSSFSMVGASVPSGFESLDRPSFSALAFSSTLPFWVRKVSAIPFNKSGKAGRP